MWYICEIVIYAQKCKAVTIFIEKLIYTYIYNIYIIRYTYIDNNYVFVSFIQISFRVRTNFDIWHNIVTSFNSRILSISFETLYIRWLVFTEFQSF